MKDIYLIFLRFLQDHTVCRMSPKPAFFIVCGDLVDAFPDKWPEIRSKHKEAFSTLVECLQMTHLHFTNVLENWLSYSLKCLFQQNKIINALVWRIFTFSSDTVYIHKENSWNRCRSHWPQLISRIFLDVSSLIFSIFTNAVYDGL